MHNHRTTAFTSLFLLLLLPGFTADALVNMRDFGIQGDGETDETAAIQRAVDNAEAGMLVFPRGDYRITDTIEIHLTERGRTGVTGADGSARIIMDGPGPAFRFVGTHDGTANPGSVSGETWDLERTPRLSNIEIVGAHPEADGVAFVRTMQSIVEGVLIRDVRHGVHYIERNRNTILERSHIYNCSGVGVFFDNVNLHQANVTGNHISYCDGGGIRVEGGEIRNLQITGNDIEYNYDEDADASADVWIDAQDGSVREGTIASNTIQARRSPGGANIRFEAPDHEGQSPVGMWAITGNLIGSQETNIHLKNASGVSVAGNHIYTAGTRTIHIDGSRSVTISGNSMDQEHNLNDDLPNGVLVEDSTGVILQGNVLTDAFAGSEEAGGAVEVRTSAGTLVSGNQILGAGHRGVWIEDSPNTQVSDCQILGRNGSGAMQAAIEAVGDNPGLVIRNNVYHEGTQGGILAPEDAAVEGNIQGAE